MRVALEASKIPRALIGKAADGDRDALQEINSTVKATLGISGMPSTLPESAKANNKPIDTVKPNFTANVAAPFGATPRPSVGGKQPSWPFNECVDHLESWRSCTLMSTIFLGKVMGCFYTCAEFSWGV